MGVGVQLFLLLCFFGSTVRSEPWDIPPFEVPEGVSGLKEGDYDPVRDIQNIELDENIDYNIVIANILYTGAETPTIGTFYRGSNINLGAVIEKDSKGTWTVVITKAQDYEVQSNQVYLFEINVGVNFAASINIDIQNLDDEKPTLSLFTAKCEVNEGPPNVSETCKLKLFDADGFLDNMKYSIKRNGEDDTTFQLVEVEQLDGYTLLLALEVLIEIKFTENTVFILSASATDGGGNISEDLLLQVLVNDMPGEPPKWVQPLAVETFDEMEEQVFVVQAIDGDTQINKDINYELVWNEDENYEELIKIDKTSGTITAMIDRDKEEKEIFIFAIKAFKVTDKIEENTSITSRATFVVNDINNKRPIITTSDNKYEVSIPETSFVDLEFKDLKIHDRDLGQNAMYTIKLESEGINYPEAFTIIPGTGYQNINAIITIIKASMLDYEEAGWKVIKMEIVATETATAVGDTDADPKRFTTQTVIINLINRNDELPIFTPSGGYTANVLETVGIGHPIAKVDASDRDEGDKVELEIASPIDEILSIDDDGNIVTIVDNAFDFDVQSKLMVQIIARDTMTDAYDCPTIHCHETFTQLTLTIEDVNNKAPSLRTPSGTLNIMENSPEGTPVNLDNLLIGTDLDTTAYLEFEIDWLKSYASKRGAETKTEEFYGCLEIETIREANNKRVTGLIKVKEIRAGVTIDYEMFDILSLAIKIKDSETDDNFIECCSEAEATLTIRIGDENDCPPEFVDFPTDRTVLDRSPNTVVMTIQATDKDDPPHNEIVYSIKPKDDKEKVLSIHSTNGEITVTGLVDADEPPRWTLDYVVTATDGVHTVDKDLIIEITDVNNKDPTDTDPDTDSFQVSEDEKTGYHIAKITASDADRDDPNNKVSYRITFPNEEASEIFAIDEATGDLKVIDGDKLDRDRGENKYALSIVMRDRYGLPITTETRTTTVVKTIILLDVNDNKPLLPNTLTKTTISENEKKGSHFVDVEATDIDEEGPNSNINYMMTVAPSSVNNDPRPGYEDLFGIETIDKKIGRITVTKDLKYYYGKWNLKIDTTDEGIPQQSDSKTYEIEIIPFNFMTPEFRYPDRDNIYLREENLAINSALILASGRVMNSLEGIDDDGGVNSELDFDIVGGSDVFAINPLTTKTAQLVLKINQNVPSVNEITLRVKDNGEDPRSSTKTVTFNFIPTEGAPIFGSADRTREYSFPENSTGFDIEHLLPDAIEPKNEGIEEGDDRYRWPIFYHIMDNIGDYQHFKIEQRLVGNDNKYHLQVQEMLDYEDKEIYTLKIAVDNYEVKPTSPASQSVLDITINVINVNDNPPNFDKPLYSSGLTADDTSKKILQVHATDLDNDPIAYTILHDTMVTSDSSLNSIKDTLFVLDKDTGILSQGATILADMTGFFEFLIEASDSEPERHTDTTQVKIYVLSATDRVTFVFMNNVDDIESNRDLVEQIFSDHFKYNCNIDSITTHTEKSARADEVGKTDVVLHFIDNNEVVKREVIEKMSGDQDILTAMNEEFRSHRLFLVDMAGKNTGDVDNLADMLKTILIVVSVVLGILCIVMFLAFIIKTRSLNRELKAIKTTTFGSQSSDINRGGLKSAPTTNQYSVERSNPVMSSGHEETNNNNMFGEAENESSDDDDDLIGVENNPEFSYNNAKNTTTPNADGVVENGRRKSNNPLGQATINIDMDVQSPPFQQKY